MENQMKENRTKKILSLFLAAVMLIVGLPVVGLTFEARAYDGTQYGSTGIYYEISNGEVTITDADEDIETANIPGSIRGYPVTSIGSVAFFGCTSLTSVTIPDSVTRIGSSVFGKCAGLKSLSVAEDNKIYHSQNNCIIETKSKTLVVGCKNSIIPTDGSVTSIGYYAFSGCTGLTGITIPDSVTVIDYSAFEGCSGLANVKIPNSVTSIDTSAFIYCSGLQSLSVAEGNKTYHSQNNCIIKTRSKILVIGCKNSIIPTDGSVTRIGDSAFIGCTGLTSATIPDGITSIGKGAFSWCTGLTSITIPDSITSIGDSAFWGCTGLTSITIPDSVTSIGECAFGYYYDEEDYEVYRIDGFVVKGVRNTAAETYANENGFKFVALDGEQEHKHKYIEVIVEEATCTAKGINGYMCECGEYYIKFIPATGHKTVTDKAIAATCTKNGKTAGLHCSVCGAVIKAQKTVPALGHKYKTTTKKATTSKDGKAVTACTVCKKVSKTTVIYKASSVKLSKTSYTYNGKTQKPKVVIKNSKGKLLTEGKDYTVKYPKGMKNPGTYTVTVTFKGNYSGKKTLTFTIAPKAPTLKVKAGTKKATLSWNKQTGATGYNVYMATSKNGKYKKIATVKVGSKTSYTAAKLTKGKTVYFKVTAYTVSGKTTVNSAYSKAVGAKIK